MEREKSIIYRQIGAKVAYQRMLHDMTQDELAARVHVSKSTIGRIERGRYNQGVSLSTIMDIADGLGIEMIQLLTFTEQEKKLQTAPVPPTKNGGGGGKNMPLLLNAFMRGERSFYVRKKARWEKLRRGLSLLRSQFYRATREYKTVSDRRKSDGR